MPKKEPTAQQARALARFASRHGRQWKSKLKAAWTIGNDYAMPDGALLRQVRNELGPKWLSGYALAGVSATCTQVTP